MTTYNVDASAKHLGQLPSEVTVENQQELHSTVADLQKRVGQTTKLKVDEKTNTIRALEFTRD